MTKLIDGNLLSKIVKFTNNRPLTALKNGMMYTIPFIISGAFFLLLTSLPVQSWAKWMTNTGLVPYFSQAYSFSFASMSIWAVAGIAYEWAKAEKVPPLPAAFVSLAGFLITMKPTTPIIDNSGKILIKNVTELSGIIDKTWLGGQGMIAAIIVGLITGWIYTWFVKNKITIRLPDQVPANVSNSFIALIPAFVITTFWMIVYMVFDHFYHTSLVEWIYKTLQTPLQGVTDSFSGVVIISLLLSLLWLLGVHGSAIIMGIMSPILLSNSSANAALLKSGKTITAANGGHIFTQALFDQFGVVTGAGLTFGIVIYLVFFAKSAQLKGLGKLEAIPSIFNINEPLLFGLPIVLNPILALPFILTPLLSMTLTYAAIKFGILPYFNGLYVPWTMPPIFSGFIVGGWKIALWQTFVLIASFFIYLPFIHKLDQILLSKENNKL